MDDNILNRFNSRGFDLYGSFQVGKYNELVDSNWKIETFGNDNNLCLVIASSKAIWDHFKNWIRLRIDSIPNDPLDDYCIESIRDIITNYNPYLDYRVYFDWNQEAPCHMQTAGHLAGIAHYQREILWSVHPVFGIWFAFRALIVFKSLEMSNDLPPVPPAIITQTMIEDMRKLAAVYPLWWKDPILSRKYRNIVKSGSDIEYVDEQLSYHCISHSSVNDRNKYLISIIKH